MQMLMLGPDLSMAVLAIEIRLFAQCRYLLVLALVAVLLACSTALRRCCACGILPLIVIEPRGETLLDSELMANARDSSPFARGHSNQKTKNLFARVRETRRQSGGCCRAGQGRAKG